MIRGIVAVVLLVGLPVAGRMTGDPFLLSLATRAAILAIAAVSLQFVVGYGGMVSFGHAAFLGIGGYVLAGLDADAAISLPLALAAGGGFAAVTGWAALRTSGVTFIMITLAFAQMAFFVAQSLDAFGGSDGAPLDPPALFGGDALRSSGTVYGVALGLLILVAFLGRKIAGSRFGRVLRAAADNPARTAAAGFDVRRVRLAAYAGAGAVAASAGWLLALHAQFISPAVMDWRRSGELLVMVILGGAGTPEGAALGAVGLTLGEEALSRVTDHWRLILGPLIVLVVLWGAWTRRRPG